jgi:cation diffusion facilitator family transporter
MSSAPGNDSDRGERLALGATVLNVALLAALVAAFAVSSSLLALAQAGDSLVDLVLSALLVWATRVGAQPGDEEHPHGHHAAEPIAALIVAFAAGFMAIELTVSAIERVVSGVVVTLRPLVLVIFVTKGGTKAVLAVTALRVHRVTRGPAAKALWVDSRNDVLVSLVAVLGYFLVTNGQPAWDAWLAIPTAGWIARSGFLLARDNVQVLMGSRTSARRQRELGEVVSAVAGVESFHGLVAKHHGTHLDVTVHVVLDESLPLRQAHDIGDTVSAALMAEPDVAHVAVHLDVEDDRLQEG